MRVLCAIPIKKGHKMQLKSLFKLGRVHVPHFKNTAEMPAVKMPAPEEVFISMSQNIGAPSNPCVAVGDRVYVGTLIGEAGGYVGAPVHSSVSGTVKKIDSYIQSSGRTALGILIESDGEMTLDPAIKPPSITDIDSLSAAARDCGLVGLGGAGFPTSVKLDAEKKGLIKKIILNGAECEPYITSDTRTMLDCADDIKRGVELLLAHIRAEELIIGIESNKPECIAKMEEVFSENAKVSVKALPATYPQGGEKVLIYNTTGLIIPEGKLPADVGCLVMNVTTVATLAKYAETGIPLVEKCITVDGSAVKCPQNLIVPVGTRIKDVIEFAGGCSEEPGKILYGGPMMGSAIVTVDEPILKNTNAITVLNKKDSKGLASTACIHCGRCLAACPMGLNPTAFAKAMNIPELENRVQMLNDAGIGLCIECGCCSYVCPAKRPLVQNHRLGKQDSRAYAMAKQAESKKMSDDNKKVGEKGDAK